MVARSALFWPKGNRCVTGTLALLIFLASPSASSNPAESYFKKIKTNPPLLRQFLYRLPKGGELHTHLDGAVYAESLISWAGADGKCIDWPSLTITLPPCDASAQRPAVADIQFNPTKVNRLIDAFSVRNYELGTVSGHDQFFATFTRFDPASWGRQGDMLAEVAARAARQNTLYLEIMQSFGMAQARKLAVDPGLFDAEPDLSQLAQSSQMNALLAHTIQFTDGVEQQWRNTLGCDVKPDKPGCAIQVRYLAQVIRTFPREQVLAQTLLAFKLIAADPRYVGLNFVAPEDAPTTLRDYTAQMKIIRDVAAQFPGHSAQVTLHAGELAMPLVAPEEMRSHIFEAIHIAGARRIGHGVDIVHEDEAMDLLKFMAGEGILVEINLTSNAVILGIEGDEHPFALYRSSGVPLALSTDDEGVSRIDLTHEYQRATRNYDLSYDYLKELSRNALAYSFLPGDSLFENVPKARKVKACVRDRVGRSLSKDCGLFMSRSEKARLQWQLEERFAEFEAGY